MEIEKNVKRFIDKTLKKQQAASDKARLEFEQSGNPNIVIEYLKKSKFAAGLAEPWIREAIQKLMCTDQSDLLKKAFSRRPGENKGARMREIEYLYFAERIDESRRAGQSLNMAFITELQNTGNGNLEGEMLNQKLTAIRNKYHRAKRIIPEITIQETAESFTLTAFPAKVVIPDYGGACFGKWTMTISKK